MKGWEERLIRVSGTDDLHLGWLPGKPINCVDVKDLRHQLNIIANQWGFSLLFYDRTLPSNLGNVAEYQLRCNRYRKKHSIIIIYHY
jgi:hypothetical protein